jgi:hypothetical protein
VKSLARRLILILLHDKRTAEKVTEALVEQLANARSFDQANKLSGLLASEAPLLTREQVARLRAAEKTNGELQGAFDFDNNVSAIEAKLHAATPQTAASDYEEPF